MSKCNKKCSSILKIALDSYLFVHLKLKFQLFYSMEMKIADMMKI